LLLKKAKKELVVTNETKTKEITTKDVVAPVLRYSTISQVAKVIRRFCLLSNIGFS
jgi:hypothetical protein